MSFPSPEKRSVGGKTIRRKLASGEYATTPEMAVFCHFGSLALSSNEK